MKDASKWYKVKDFVFLGIVTAIYVVAYSAIGGLTAALNALGHAFSPAIFSLIGGTIILFLVYKVPKLGILTLQTLLVHGLIAVLGMAYLPWFITSIIGALIADGIAATSQYKNTIKNGKTVTQALIKQLHFEHPVKGAFRVIKYHTQAKRVSAFAPKSAPKRFF